MEITDVRIKLVTDSTERLRAFCTITFDGEFVVRDIKLVEGVNGMFVAMPSRKLSSSCPKCRHKNPLQSRYCSECGASLPSHKVPTDEGGRLKLYRDIAHPITTSFRQTLQDRVVEAYEAERERATDADYMPAAYDAGDTDAPGSFESLDSGFGTTDERPGRDRDQSHRGERRDGPPGTERPPGEGRKRRRRRRRRPPGEERGEEPPRPETEIGEPEVTTPADTAAEEVAVEPVFDAPEAFPVGDEPAAVEPAVAEPIFDAPQTFPVADEPVAPGPPPATTEGRTEEVSLGESAEEPPKSTDADDDTTAFGAGII